MPHAEDVVTQGDPSGPSTRSKESAKSTPLRGRLGEGDGLTKDDGRRLGDACPAQPDRPLSGSITMRLAPHMNRPSRSRCKEDVGGKVRVWEPPAVSRGLSLVAVELDAAADWALAIAARPATPATSAIQLSAIIAARVYEATIRECDLAVTQRPRSIIERAHGSSDRHRGIDTDLGSAVKCKFLVRRQNHDGGDQPAGHEDWAWSCWGIRATR